MKIGDMIFAEYGNGKLYTGEIVTIKEIANKGSMITINDPQGYKSLYVEKCVSFEIWETSN